jgi:hypothetical protein
MRYWEIRAEHQGCYDEDGQQPLVIMEWWPMVQSQIHRPTTAINMVITLPYEFKVGLEEELDTDETTGQIILDPYEAIFEKLVESKH